jgi:hypothetical protein
LRLQIAVEQAQVLLDAIHALRNPREVNLGLRHHLQKMTALGLAEFDPRSYSRDLEGVPRVHATGSLELRDYDSARGEMQLGELTGSTSLT